MKKLVGLIACYFIFQVCFGQEDADDSWHDRLQQQLSVALTDEEKVDIWSDLANFHKFSRPDSGIYYGSRALALARSISYRRGEAKALHNMALSYSTLGNESKSLKINLECLKLAEENNITDYEGYSLVNLGYNYYASGDFPEALTIYQRAYSVFILNEDPLFATLTESFIGSAFLAMDQYDSALFYCLHAKDKAESLNTGWVKYYPYTRLAEVYQDVKHVDSAFFYFRKANDSHGHGALGESYSALALAKLFEETGKTDSAIFYANDALEIARSNNLFTEIIKASKFFSEVYENDPVSALNYTKMTLAYTDSLAKLSNMTSFSEVLDFDEQQRQYELESAQKEFQSRLRTNIFLGSTFTLIVIGFFLFRNSRQKQKAKQEIELAYDQLKNTQSQLIQSEKMASLGELTAGIAHEIQNPLNFVNNFSEVNEELLVEMKEELDKGNIDEAKSIANDAIENQQKILHHGKRADVIVKGMLQHSRTSTGKKEPTDLNALSDEYLRLAYHAYLAGRQGLRAKDNSFNAKFETQLDDTLPKVNVVPQDMGRVILNLITNAFYVVNEKSKTAHEGYEPTVTLSTRQVNGKVEISVKDNGPGIPEEIKDKIFQPFFTTKPTGSGTGLGLSLSYDIVKAHGGTIEVESANGKGTKLIILLPVTQS